VPAPGSLVRLAAYGAGSLLVVGLAGVLLPRALEVGRTFLTDSGSLLVAVVLYLVGGWGLGRDIELERDLAQSRVVAMRAHLDPHFLYNTLNAIAEWCREDAAQAETAILRLSAMLEGVFAGLEQRAWPLRRELALLEDLVALHRVRDPGALSLELGIEGPADDVEVSPLVLLLLLENAIKHGARKGYRGPITVGVTIQPGDVRVVVENPGPYQPGGPGRGLTMLRRQLEVAYGADASIEIEALDARTRATLWLPRRHPR
jgi:two-component system sensor histidine kinase AlgZ